MTGQHAALTRRAAGGPGAVPALSPVPARPGRRPAGLDLTAVPTFGAALVQRCGGAPEPCSCHDPDASSMSSQETTGAGSPSGGSGSGEVLLQRHTDQSAPLGAERTGAPGTAGGAATTLIRHSIADSGAPLPDSARVSLETTLGADLSSVRVHTGPTAAAATTHLGAQAYTVGEHIVLGSGAASGSSGARRIVAHEAAHVLQQRASAHPDPLTHPEFRVGDPGDARERQADAVADAATGAGAAAPPPALAGTGAWEVSHPHDADELAADHHAGEALVRLSADPGAAGTPVPRPTAVPESFDRAFGHDFSRVGVHTDGAAAALTARLSAQAVTLGRQIFFGPGRYRPGTAAGDRLLAHELAHVVQHDHDPQPRMRRQSFSCTDLLAAPGLTTLMSGSAVHRVIQGDFMTSVPGGSVTTVIPGASAGPLRSQGICGGDTKVIPPQSLGGRAGAGLPDLSLRNAGGVLLVGEIKPAVVPCLVDGEEQLLRYIDQGNARDDEQRQWRAAQGITTVSPMLPAIYPGRILDAGVATITTGWCGPGLMGYVVRPKKKEKEKEDQPQPSASKSPEKDTEKSTQKTADKSVDTPGQPAQLPPGEPARVPVEAPGTGTGVPATSVDADPSGIPELLVAAAVLAAAAKRANLQQAERLALEAAYKRTMTKMAEKGAVSTAERLMINGVKLGSQALEKTFAKGAQEELEKDLERMSAKQLEKLALREGEALAKQEGKQLGKAAAKQVGRRIAGKAVAKAIPYLGVLLFAADALAAADHVSKGGTIEFGLSGSDVDLSGSTKVEDKGAPKGGGSAQAALTDTRIDIETSGVPDVSGSVEIDAKKVTITGSSRGDGTAVTVNFKAKLSNSTITITHGGVLRGGKVVFGGDVTVTDSQIEIDLPPEAAAPPPSAAPVVISGRKLKITKAGGGGAGGDGTGSGPGSAPGAPPPAGAPPVAPPLGPVTPPPEPVTPPPAGTTPAPPATAPTPELPGLSAAARSRVAAAGKPAEALVAALIKPGTKGPKVNDASVDAILKILADQHVTGEEMDELRARIGPQADSLDALLATLTKNIQELRAAPAAPGSPPSGPAAPPPQVPDPNAAAPADPAAPKATAPAKPFDAKDPKFDRVGPGQFWVSYQASAVPAVGSLIPDQRGFGKTSARVAYEFTVSLKVVSVSGVTTRGANLRVEVVGSSSLTTATGQQPSHFSAGQQLSVRLTLVKKP